MAVSTSTVTLVDRSKKTKIDVHSIKITKGNKKGAAEAIGGVLVEKDGSWWIELVTRVNGRVVKRILRANDIAFKTGTNNRWQVTNTVGFNKRFIVH